MRLARRPDLYLTNGPNLRRRKDKRFATELFAGKIVDLARQTRGGFAFGRATIAGTAADGSDCEIEFQNENLLARRNGHVVAMVPDLICIVDAETAEPITTEALKYGQRVKIIGVSVPPIMRTEAALTVFGPGAFGLDLDYRPIEALSDLDRSNHR